MAGMDLRGALERLCKTIFDFTVPFSQKERFRRARFLDVAPEKRL